MQPGQYRDSLLFRESMQQRLALTRARPREREPHLQRLRLWQPLVQKSLATSCVRGVANSPRAVDRHSRRGRYAVEVCGQVHNGSAFRENRSCE
jgi:hypothetical protein